MEGADLHDWPLFHCAMAQAPPPLRRTQALLQQKIPEVTYPKHNTNSNPKAKITQLTKILKLEGCYLEYI